ncbi:MAG: tail fiber protein [Rhizobacter sp.]|nr:tail fiber protein [Burkholderiales bacterium]
MSNPFLGEIKMLGFNFAPRGSALCNGQIISIQQNTALFSLLGTTYGGNGTTTFALPDFRGRFPTNAGQGPGLSNQTLGQIGGAESTTLLPTQMPVHNHLIVGSTATGNSNSPTNNVLAVSSTRGGTEYAAAATAPTTLHATSVSSSGGNQPVSTMPPFLAVTFAIFMTGVFPSRN